MDFDIMLHETEPAADSVNILLGGSCAGQSRDKENRTG